MKPPPVCLQPGCGRCGSQAFSGLNFTFKIAWKFSGEVVQHKSVQTMTSLCAGADPVPLVLPLTCK